MKEVFVFFAAISATCSFAYSADLSSCASTLDEVASAARSLADEAESAQSAAQEAADAQAKYVKCQRDPDSYDTYGDKCETLERRYKRAKSDLDTALSSLQSELSTVQSRMSDIDSTCSTGPVRRLGDQSYLCPIYKQLRADKKFSDAELMRACVKRMTEAECKACLGLP